MKGQTLSKNSTFLSQIDQESIMIPMNRSFLLLFLHLSTHLKKTQQPAPLPALKNPSQIRSWGKRKIQHGRQRVPKSHGSQDSRKPEVRDLLESGS